MVKVGDYVEVERIWPHSWVKSEITEFTDRIVSIVTVDDRFPTPIPVKWSRSTWNRIWEERKVRPIAAPPLPRQISGRVTDPVFKKAIGGAKIEFLGEVVYTNLLGNYAIFEPRIWYGTMKCSKAGFVTAEKFVTTPSVGILTVDFELSYPPVAPPKPTLKVLPEPGPEFTGRGLELYYELDDALDRKDVTKVLSILREGLDVEMSPIVFMAALLLIAKVVAVIMGVIGTYAFAKFIMEEALQTIDMSIWTLSKAKEWGLEGVALAKKKEILDYTPIETIVSYIPGINLIAALRKYFEASETKYDLDLKLWRTHQEASGVNPNVDLDAAEAAIERGEDPTPYLPTAETETVPEIIDGKVISVIDGDSIEVQTMAGYIYEVRMVGIDAPEFRTIAGKESTRVLTDKIHGKTVKVKTDPLNLRDKYNRILGVVFLNGIDINKQMLEEGMASYYFIRENKWVVTEDYKAAAKRMGKVKIYSKPTYCKVYVDGIDTGKLTIETLDLMEGDHTISVTKEGYVTGSQTVTVIPDETIEKRFELMATALPVVVGPPVIPEEVVEVPEEIPEVPIFKIYITSTPSNAKLYIDDVYTHHWTPSNEKELKDVIHLLTPGTHKITVTRAGYFGEKTVDITSGDNGVIHFDLEVVGLPPVIVVPPVVVPPTLEVRLLAIEEVIKAIREKLEI